MGVRQCIPREWKMAKYSHPFAIRQLPVAQRCIVVGGRRYS
jgi:hypothetical protein